MKKLICYAAGGLANRVLPLASAIEYARESDRELLLFWPRDFRCDANFHNLYDEKIKTVDESFMNTVSAKYYVKDPTTISNDVRLYGRTFLQGKPTEYREPQHDPNVAKFDTVVVCSNTFLDEVSISLSKQSLKRLEIKKRLKYSVESLSSSLGLNKDVLGMHVRGTDFGPPKNWQSDLANIVKGASKKIFICSDEKSVERSAKAMLPNNVIIRPGKKSVSMLNANLHSWQNNVYTSLESLEDAIIDIYLLAKTNMVSYNTNSSFARYAKILSE
jgi:hypothetical protein